MKAFEITISGKQQKINNTNNNFKTTKSYTTYKYIILVFILHQKFQNWENTMQRKILQTNADKYGKKCIYTSLCEKIVNKYFAIFVFTNMYIFLLHIKKKNCLDLTFPHMRIYRRYPIIL